MQELTPGQLWVKTVPLNFLGLKVGARMTVIRLGDGGLFLHSPTRLDAATRSAVEGLGPVRHVIAPNRFHHLFVEDYLRAYAQARFYAAPGLAEKRRDLRFDAVLGDEAPPAWADELDQLLIRGIPRFNEVVFHHRASRTLILTDLLFNIQEESPFSLRAVTRIAGVYGRPSMAPDMRRFQIKDRPAFAHSIERLLAWDVERIVLAHGRVIAGDGRQALREAFAWLNPESTGR